MCGDCFIYIIEIFNGNSLSWWPREAGGQLRPVLCRMTRSYCMADQLGLCRETRNLIHKLQPAPAHLLSPLLHTDTQYWIANTGMWQPRVGLVPTWVQISRSTCNRLQRCNCKSQFPIRRTLVIGVNKFKLRECVQTSIETSSRPCSSPTDGWRAVPPAHSSSSQHFRKPAKLLQPNLPNAEVVQ